MDLEPIVQPIREELTRKQASRDEALRLSRETIRFCANSIRATHRGESDKAMALFESASHHLRQLTTTLADHVDLRYTGFVDDAQKEFAEAAVTYAIVFQKSFPSAEELDVDYAPYLNGLGEAASELRRYVLDRIRVGDFSRSEETLGAMDEVYRVLVTMDFPDGMTGGLRRTTDALRAVLERTRGDLTMALRQQALSEQLAEFRHHLDMRAGSGGVD